jgi:hypothetical protein
MLASLSLQAEVWQARYGVSDRFDFKLYNADGTLDVDEVDGGTEVSLSCDEGAETTATNDFVDEGTTYSILLTAAEMRCARITVVVAATTTEAFFIQTNGLAGVIDEGTAQAATATTLQLRSAAAFADDEIIGATCVITSATAGAGQARTITDYVSSTDTATVATWTTTPTGTITYQCHGTAAGTGSVTIASGGISSSSFTAGAIDAAALAADAGTEIGTATWATTTRALTILDEDSTTLDLNATALGSVAGAVGSVTGNLGGTINGLTATAQGHIRDLVVEDQGSLSLGCVLAAITAAVAGDVATTGGNSTFEEATGAETRVASVVVTAGNRTTTITCPTY